MIAVNRRSGQITQASNLSENQQKNRRWAPVHDSLARPLHRMDVAHRVRFAKQTLAAIRQDEREKAKALKRKD